MTKIKKESVVELNGDLKSLVIKINGIIVYPGKIIKPTKSKEPRKEQIDHTNATQFARCINKVPILKKIWKQKKTTKYTTIDKYGVEKSGEYKQKSNFGKPAAFNKILSVNKKVISKLGHPGIDNMIVPETDYSFPYTYKADFNI